MTTRIYRSLLHALALTLALSVFAPQAWSDDSVAIDPNILLLQFQDTITAMQGQSNDALSQELRNFYNSFSDDFESKAYQSFSEQRALLFLYSMARFVFFAQSFNVSQEGIADIRSIREYLAVAFSLKRKFSDQPLFAFLADSITAQFIAYLLQDSYFRQTDVLYERLIETKDDYPEWVRGYDHLLAGIEFSILKSNIQAQKFYQLSKLHARLENRAKAFGEDLFLKRISLSATLLLLQYRFASNAQQIPSLDAIPRVERGYYQQLMAETETEQPQWQLLRIRALSIVAPLIDQSQEPGRELREDVVSKINDSIAYALTCQDDASCTTILYNALVALAASVPDAYKFIEQDSTAGDQAAPANRVPDWYGSYAESVVASIAGVLEESRQINFSLPFAQVLFKRSVAQLYNQEFDPVTKTISTLQQMRTRTDSVDIAYLELKLRLALLQEFEQFDQPSMLTALLSEQEQFDESFKQRKDFLIESFNTQLSVIRRLNSANKFETARPLLRQATVLAAQLQEDSLLVSLATVYAQSLINELRGSPPVSWSNYLDHLNSIARQVNQAETVIRLSSRARLAIIEHLTKHASSYRSWQSEISKTLQGFSAVRDALPADLRHYIDEDELVARTWLKEACLRCDQSFKELNKKRISALQR